MRFNKQKLIFIGVLFLINPFLGFTQEDVIDQKKAEALLVLAQERDRVAAEALEEVKSKRTRLEEDLIDADENPNFPKTERKKMEAEVKLLKNREKELVQKRQYANNLLLDVTEVLKAIPKKRAKFIADYEAVYGVIDLNSPMGQDPVFSTATAPAVTSSTPETTQTASEETPKTVEKKEKTKKPKKEKPESASKKELAHESQAVVSTEPAQPNTPQNEPIISLPSEPRPNEPVAMKGEKNQSKNKKSKSARTDTPPSHLTDKPSTDVGATPSNAPNEPGQKPEPTGNQAQVEDKKVKAETKKKKETANTATAPAPVFINYREYTPKEDVLLNPPSTTDCQLVFDGIDSFTGKKKEETAPILLFAQTDDFMRPAMKDGKEYVSCDISATRVEGARFVYLNLTITIQTKDAQRSFGFLDRNSAVIFKFINGKRQTYFTTKTDIGTVDIEKGTTIFRIQIPVTDPNELLQSELDAVRIAWSAGYEDYEIFNMTILESLINCLNKAKP